ncbi:MAG: hypothetical protein OXG37_02950 [Actinomycetia bacterium]|nr:hypothetical protein [Actinomycetes bacterium]
MLLHDPNPEAAEDALAWALVVYASFVERVDCKIQLGPAAAAKELIPLLSSWFSSRRKSRK